LALIQNARAHSKRPAFVVDYSYPVCQEDRQISICSLDYFRRRIASSDDLSVDYKCSAGIQAIFISFAAYEFVLHASVKRIDASPKIESVFVLRNHKARLLQNCGRVADGDPHLVV
jgi:hypothetical protein